MEYHYCLLIQQELENTDDIVENIGVEKSKELINSADLILYVIDTSREIDEEDYRIYDIINTDKVIGILNKIDIKKKNYKNFIKSFLKLKNG